MTSSDDRTPTPPVVADTGTAVLDVEEPEELLIEEISIDGMCGVY